MHNLSARSDNAVFNLKQIDRTLINDLLVPIPEKPEHLTANDTKDIVKRLEAEFYWYPILQDSARTFVFSRSIVFVSILKGLAQMFDEEAYDGKILVKVIKHPVNKGKHDITFAVLVGYPGPYVDGSRWLILYNCATDYSGYGGEIYQKVRCAIKELKEKAEVETSLIEKNNFEIYLREKSISDIQNADAHKLEMKFMDYAGKARGQLFEFVVYKWMKKHFCCEYAEVNVWINNEQIDCYGKNNEIIDLFECKISLHNVEKTVKQIQRKFEAIKKKYPNYEIRKNLAVFEDLSEDNIEKLKQTDIVIHGNFKNKITAEREFNESRREFLEILNNPFAVNTDMFLL